MNVNVKDLNFVGLVPTELLISFLTFTSLKKAHSENKVQVKVNGFGVSERVNFQSSSIF